MKKTAFQTFSKGKRFYSGLGLEFGVIRQARRVRSSRSRAGRGRRQSLVLRLHPHTREAPARLFVRCFLTARSRWCVLGRERHGSDASFPGRCRGSPGVTGGRVSGFPQRRDAGFRCVINARAAWRSRDDANAPFPWPSSPLPPWATTSSFFVPVGLFLFGLSVCFGLRFQIRP